MNVGIILAETRWLDEHGRRAALAREWSSEARFPALALEALERL
jgi:hypothetical protein